MEVLQPAKEVLDSLSCPSTFNTTLGTYMLQIHKLIINYDRSYNHSVT